MTNRPSAERLAEIRAHHSRHLEFPETCICGYAFFTCPTLMLLAEIDAQGAEAEADAKEAEQVFRNYERRDAELSTALQNAILEKADLRAEVERLKESESCLLKLGTKAEVRHHNDQRQLSTERTVKEEALRDLTEARSFLDWIYAILRDQPGSDFALSFGLVREVADLKQEKEQAIRERQELIDGMHEKDGAITIFQEQVERLRAALQEKENEITLLKHHGNRTVAVLDGLLERNNDGSILAICAKKASEDLRQACKNK